MENGTPLDPEEIKVYDDYIRSGAALAFIAADSIVSFYAKDKDMLNALAMSCGKYCEHEGVAEKDRPVLFTCEENQRTGFRVN